MKIRVMKTSDYESVKNLLIDVQLIHYENRPDIYKPVDIITKKQFKRMLSDYNLVATQNDEVVGFLIASEKHTLEKEFMKSIKMLFIESFGVKKEFQQQGIGKELINTIFNMAEQEKFETVELNVLNFNQEAKLFYEKMGMTPKSQRYERRINNGI